MYKVFGYAFLGGQSDNWICLTVKWIKKWNVNLFLAPHFFSMTCVYYTPIHNY